ncbi:MAG: permease-like cell division protein FtsX [Candidatus Nanopelagicales bacterium]|nr:permease-like cell division protein FtsX [Candidatus Nanopelagicales bacterium]
MRRLGLALKEVGHGLRRNLTMTIAVILTIAVSLTLFGTGLLVRGQVDAMKDYWYDRVEVSVFLCGQASDPKVCAGGPVTDVQREAIKTKLTSLSPTVEEVYYESAQEAYDRFRTQFKNSPILENVTAESMPESFRVKLANPEEFATVAAAVGNMSGVEQVQDQRKLLAKFFKILGGLQAIALGIAIAMLFVTVLLVVNTMRVAAYSRRRETGIMKLVGASNLYIQLPFLLEAVIAAAVGGLLAVGAIAAQKHFLVDQVLEPSFRFTAFVGWPEVIQVMIIIFVTGVVLSGAAALLTVRRYLKV